LALVWIILPVGIASGAAIGTCIGSGLEKKHKVEIRPRQMRKKS